MSFISGCGAPPTTKGPFNETADVRMRVGTLLGEVTKVVVVVLNSVVALLIADVVLMMPAAFKLTVVFKIAVALLLTCVA